MKMYKWEKMQGILKMILFIVELFVIVKHFSIYGVFKYVMFHLLNFI